MISINRICIIIVYLVILAGGVVRCTGSGMGCPDWPKCFGCWIPPTNIKELPSNYVEKYSKGGKLTVEFNTLKTWTEYVNRLLGAILGLAMFIQAVFAIGWRKKSLSVMLISFFALILVGFQGWLGSRVVATNLSPYMISIHMTVALIIVFLLLWIKNLLKINPILFNNKSFNTVLILGIAITFIQIWLGTQVRQEIDHISKSLQYQARELWIDQLSNVFTYHRLVAYGVVLVSLAYFWQVKKNQLLALSFNSKLIIALVFVEFMSGLILTYFSLYSLAQPIHLLVATGILGVYFDAIQKGLIKQSN